MDPDEVPARPGAILERMVIIDEPDWREPFILTSQTLTPGERNQLARAASNGGIRRVAPGAYVVGGCVDAGGDAVHRDLVHARHLISRTSLTFSHGSAASLWRLPRLGDWPERAHALAEGRPGRSTAGLVRHSSGPVVPDLIDGVAVTPLARTAVDLALTEPFAVAVVALDAALAGVELGGHRWHVTRRELLERLGSIGVARGSRRARTAVDFADAAAGSPGESLSRVSVARAKLTAPTLQREFRDESGRMFVDFWWEQWGVVGEFDGLAKYLRDDLTRERSPADMVIEEKKREDRLRRIPGVTTVVRWGWDVALSPPRLGSLLRRAGVR